MRARYATFLVTDSQYNENRMVFNFDLNWATALLCIDELKLKDCSIL